MVTGFVQFHGFRPEMHFKPQQLHVHLYLRQLVTFSPLSLKDKVRKFAESPRF